MEIQSTTEGVPPPEDFVPTPRKPLGPFQLWPEKKHILTAMLFSIAFFLVSLAYWNGAPDIFSASGASVWVRGEYWRLLSSIFVHGDLSHFGANLFPFLFFGWMLQAYFGFLVFPVLSLAVGVFSVAATVAIYSPETRLIGASGMVYGMVATWLVLYLRFDSDNPWTVKALRVVGFILMMLFPHAYDDNTSHLAHFSGFVGGLIAGALLVRVRLRYPPLPPQMELRGDRRNYMRYPRIKRVYVPPVLEPEVVDTKMGVASADSLHLGDESDEVGESHAVVTRPE